MQSASQDTCNLDWPKELTSLEIAMALSLTCAGSLNSCSLIRWTSALELPLHPTTRAAPHWGRRNNRDISFYRIQVAALVPILGITGPIARYMAVMVQLNILVAYSCAIVS